MAHLQYMPGDPRLVDQLVYELKSKGIFDQFRKDCISDVDTRPAYQNLRQRVESSVSLFLSRQTWKPDLNKNQLREKLRKHILDGNYLEQGVERIVDQVVNPKVSSVFIPQVEDLVYNYLGITRKKSATETTNDKGNSSTGLLPTDLEAVSPGSVKSNNDETMEEDKEDRMEIDVEDKSKDLNDISMPSETEQDKENNTRLSGISDLTLHDSDNSLGKLSIPMPSEDINLENIPSPENSPPKIDLDSIEMPKEESIELKDIPLPDESPKEDKEQFFKPVNSEDDSSSDSSIIRNMSPLTPIRNFNNENSCDAQQAFENDTDYKSDDKKEPSTFRFAIDTKSAENSSDDVKDKDVETKTEKQEQHEQLSYQFSEQVNINSFNTPLYDDSSNSHNLQIDYESDVNSKTNLDKIPFPDDPNSEDSKKESVEEKKVHKSSHKSRDSHRHSSSSKDRRNDSKSSSSKDRRDSKHDKKPSSKDDQNKPKSSSDKSKDRGDKKDSKDSKYKSSQSSHRSSSSKDSKHKSSSTSQRHSSKHDDKKSSSSTSKDKEKEKTSDKSSKEHRSSKDSKSRSDKDRKSKRDDKDKDKKDKKDTDDHYSASGRGNHTRRSTDRDSNDGSSSSKGSHHPSSSKSSESKTNKGSSSKSDNTSPSSECTSPSDKEKNTKANLSQSKPIVRVDTHLERPTGTPPRLPFVPDITLKKPKFAANLAEAKRLMKMRKFLDEEQKRMNQEAALLLEFQANVRPSLSQVYSSIPGPELEFACISNVVEPAKPIIETNYAEVQPIEQITDVPDAIEIELSEMNRETKEIVHTEDEEAEFYEPIEYKTNFEDTEKVLNEISRKVYGVVDENEDDNYESEFKPKEVKTEENKNERSEFEITIITEEIDESESIKEAEVPNVDDMVNNEETPLICNEDRPSVNFEDRPLEYFAEHEKFDAELERAKFEKFLKEYVTATVTNKLYLINCDAYEESIVKEVAESFGHFEIVNYHKNGHKNKNIVKDVNVSSEIVLPLDRNTPVRSIMSTHVSPVFSPVKSECSFELSSDYDAKLEEMVNKTSRQEIMEIILGGGIPSESPSKMPQIDYCMDDNIESNQDLKRKISMDTSDNNNRQVLTPSKMRKLSESDQISSTTEESQDVTGAVKTGPVRSKYLVKARRVGLPRPRRTVHPNSPSSDKSIENYDTNHTPPNGKLAQRKVQRYDTADLYKPKLHYLSRRNNIS